MSCPESVFASHRPEVPGLLCAGMPQHWFFAGQLKFAHDLSDTVMKTLEYKLWDIAVRMKNRLEWKTRKGDIGKSMLRRMARLALHEMNEPSRFNSPDAWKLRAAYIGVGKSQWFGVWSARYKVLFEELNEWTNRAYRYIMIRARKHMSESDEMAVLIIEHEANWLNLVFDRAA